MEWWRAMDAHEGGEAQNGAVVADPHHFDG